MEKKGILVVDDEDLALKYFSRAFGNRFTVYSANSAEQALKVLEMHSGEIGVIVTDQRMPESSGIELLKIVRTRFPETVRILTTAYSEMNTLVEAINAGAVYSFVSKPWELNELERTLENALEHHRGKQQDSHLLDQKIHQLKTKILEDRAYDVGLISAKMGHYVHNALCPVIFLMDQLLEKSRDSAGYSTEFVRSVRSHIYDVAKTLKDLEQISIKPSLDDCETLHLDAILDKVIADTEVLRQQKFLKIEKVSGGQLPPIKALPAHIEKIFRFMIAEEIVSLPQDSLVRVRMSPHEADDEVLGVKIEFEDFVPVSPWMCPESLLHPFNLRGSNPREFGIFLVSCYFIVRHHGGSLHASVKDDKGLSFTFFLPCDPQDSQGSDLGVWQGVREHL
jgi:CheY-like chemotaxis protein